MDLVLRGNKINSTNCLSVVNEVSTKTILQRVNRKIFLSRLGQDF